MWKYVYHCYPLTSSSYLVVRFVHALVFMSTRDDADVAYCKFGYVHAVAVVCDMAGPASTRATRTCVEQMPRAKWGLPRVLRVFLP